MGLFDKLLKTTIHAATTPLDIAKDIITLGGAATDEESAIVKKINKLKEDLDETSDEIDKL